MQLFYQCSQEIVHIRFHYYNFVMIMSNNMYPLLFKTKPFFQLAMCVGKKYCHNYYLVTKFSTFNDNNEILLVKKICLLINVFFISAWQELFLPILELKNYSKYAIGYLSQLLDNHAKMEATKVSQEQLLAMFDMVNAKKGLTKEISSDLMKQLSKYKVCCIY